MSELKRVYTKGTKRIYVIAYGSGLIAASVNIYDTTDPLVNLGNGPRMYQEKSKKIYNLSSYFPFSLFLKPEKKRIEELIDKFKKIVDQKVAESWENNSKANKLLNKMS